MNPPTKPPEEVAREIVVAWDSGLDDFVGPTGLLNLREAITAALQQERQRAEKAKRCYVCGWELRDTDPCALCTTLSERNSLTAQLADRTKERDESLLAYKQLTDHIETLFSPLNPTAHSTPELIDSAQSILRQAVEVLEPFNEIAEHYKELPKASRYQVSTYLSHFLHAAALLAKIKEGK